MRDLCWSAPASRRQAAPDIPGSVLIMANPTSGGYKAEFLDSVRTRLEDLGFRTEIRLTRHAGEIGEVCANPGLGVRTLVVAGGDGSINEALTGFQNNPDPPQLAVIPFGTANVLALELGLPRKPLAIADMIWRQKTKSLRFGLANGHPFVLMASSGFDAEIVHAVPLALKRKFGKLAYVITAFRIGFKRKASHLEISLDGETINGKFAVASNARHYGGPFVICPHGATDPGLYMLVLDKDDPWSSLRYGLALMFGRIHKARGATVRPFSVATIASTSPVAAQVDGDPFGTTPLEIRQTEKTVPVLVP
ncbi:YegS/Rv2252/BmrU family lipid kinase [Labrenzia sp. EL_208]|uniref:Diacylglycerol kinase n=1 Tax=Roseibium album TaxID=311410 RepID=A0A0M6ZNJ6_9HYPH|nr:diacylglycerol kinase family protein [Roseibium album]MBG6146151.1 YegS/Rv2252/BmrU family lipid kinase [Labrenzia sp. EL_142]MBG6154989.1 YegS/Rv2252/BmrU family lipid kinase [Labrenzia sp. EL_162]MBG6174030.1 YegS/Rv2252/BmrU family lipid kinase [Labrenzia sp. EL_132]MBG6192881.1 YegS/Rv2252/BmrU family lipid kinase [Labrenzia sp. EL_159]MBG6199268.1 YegS/Rv2252/BmrU family lipid kinase [Labrenzia sp. EL_13]MBG6228514.1 YegS/Rv2252/BmrU family lipid kinase [Labrenzia sp. EL_208]